MIYIHILARPNDNRRLHEMENDEWFTIQERGENATEAVKFLLDYIERTKDRYSVRYKVLVEEVE